MTKYRILNKDDHYKVQERCWPIPIWVDCSPNLYGMPAAEKWIEELQKKWRVVKEC